jgi:hypothetical protein
MKKIFPLLFLISFSISSFSQYEYFGTIKLNDDASKIITYRIVFSLKKGIVNGYSVTDIGGDNETKNSILGNYSSETKVLTFKESGLLYTKSKISQDSFCFVNFTGVAKLKSPNSKMEGSFKGLFKNKTKCIDGTIIMLNLMKIEKKITTLNKKAQKSILIKKEIKQRMSEISLLDSLKVNTLKKDQNLNIFVDSDEIEIEIWDSKIEDGDKIDLFLNGKRILDNYRVLNTKKILKVKLQSAENIFRIEATSEGERKLNTTMIHLIDKKRIFEMSTNLKKGEKTSISIFKN